MKFILVWPRRAFTKSNNFLHVVRLHVEETTEMTPDRSCHRQRQFMTAFRWCWCCFRFAWPLITTFNMKNRFICFSSAPPLLRMTLIRNRTRLRHIEIRCRYSNALGRCRRNAGPTAARILYVHIMCPTLYLPVN